jgi:hypothetical protein
MGRSEGEAGVYYSVSVDDGKSFAPRRLVQLNTAPEVLHSHLAIGPGDTVYLVWSNLDENQKSQIFMRSVAPDGQTWSAVQQLSNARGNASRPVVAVSADRLHVAWTETDGESSRAIIRSATVKP